MQLQKVEGETAESKAFHKLIDFTYNWHKSDLKKIAKYIKDVFSEYDYDSAKINKNKVINLSVQ